MQFYREYAMQVKDCLDRVPWSQVEKTIDRLFAAWLYGRQVFVMGNGGSAATASHMACDLGKNVTTPGQPRLRILSLNDNMALFSAQSNDNGYENVFAEQLETFVQPGDLVIAISASGNSPNVLNAVHLGRARGAFTIGLSGYTGGQLAQLVDLSIVVPSSIIEQIEDIHLILEHMMTTALRAAIRTYTFTHLVQSDGSPDGAGMMAAAELLHAPAP